MSLWAIGDLQGCLQPLERLLERIGFRPGADRLWLVGDLVNRGPDSLAVLRRVRALVEAGDAVTVLGNHDLHLLACALGDARPKGVDTLDAILAAPDRDALVDWLRRQPLLHVDADNGWAMVHAGLPPQWDLATARQCSGEAEALLRGESVSGFLRQLYGNEPGHWDQACVAPQIDRARYTINALTRLRYVDADGRLQLKFKGSPDAAGAAGLLPWFRAPGARWQGRRLVFGHWSTLGLHVANGCHGLDSGCIWGGRLTALCLESGQIEQVSCRQYQAPTGPE